MSILSRQPRLLYCADLPERRDRVFAHLVKLHPSKDPRVIGAVVAEHPELLYRMDYYKVNTRTRSRRGICGRGEGLAYQQRGLRLDTAAHTPKWALGRFLAHPLVMVPKPGVGHVCACVLNAPAAAANTGVPAGANVCSGLI